MLDRQSEFARSDQLGSVIGNCTRNDQTLGCLYVFRTVSDLTRNTFGDQRLRQQCRVAIAARHHLPALSKHAGDTTHARTPHADEMDAHRLDSSARRSSSSAISCAALGRASECIACSIWD